MLLKTLTGRNYKEEKGKLEVYGLEVIIEQRTVSDDTDYDSEEIIGQSVDPGTELKKGDKITLYIPKIEESILTWSVKVGLLLKQKNGLKKKE